MTDAPDGMDLKAAANELQKKLSDREADEFCEVLEGQHAQDIIKFPLDGHAALADAMIICGATSRRHAQGLADGLKRLCREKGYEVLGTEGYESGEWILLDCNNIIIHIFQEESRKLYRLEELWGGVARLAGGKNDTNTVADS